MGTFLDGTSRGDHEMFILGWVSVTGDADYGLYPLLHSSCFVEQEIEHFMTILK